MKKYFAANVYVLFYACVGNYKALCFFFLNSRKSVYEPDLRQYTIPGYGQMLVSFLSQTMKSVSEVLKMQCI